MLSLSSGVFLPPKRSEAGNVGVPEDMEKAIGERRSYFELGMQISRQRQLVYPLTGLTVGYDEVKER
jgi:hypothetical protein